MSVTGVDMKDMVADIHLDTKAVVAVDTRDILGMVAHQMEDTGLLQENNLVCLPRRNLALACHQLHSIIAQCSKIIVKSIDSKC